MNEPNFKQLAYDIASAHCESVSLLDDQLLDDPSHLDDVIEVLRQVWNARGAADVEASHEAIALSDYDARWRIQKLDR
jgi:hypothetical protein